LKNFKSQTKIYCALFIAHFLGLTLELFIHAAGINLALSPSE